jgi:alkanesulfonate monooxygenase SsuD/methylene tetrahydromethanopterin reductase-like flavin-dependent oxidoreductase (luciferase family)
VPKPVQPPPTIGVAANSSDIFELMGHMGLPIFVAAQVNSFPKIREYLTIYRR